MFKRKKKTPTYPMQFNGGDVVYMPNGQSYKIDPSLTKIKVLWVDNKPDISVKD